MLDLSLLQQYRAEMVALVNHVLTATASVECIRSSDFSGSAWSYDDHHLVTNHHVIEGAQLIVVRISGQSGIPATVVGTDSDVDIAVLRVSRPMTQSLPLRVEPTVLGEPCFAIGAPLGIFRESVSHGLVAGVGRRSIGPSGAVVHDLIQTDATVKPGNSGGPLVAVDGSVLGVITQRRMWDGDDIPVDGLALAVPAATVRRIAGDIIESGGRARPRLGLALRETTIVVDGNRRRCVQVLDVGLSQIGGEARRHPI